MTDLIIPNLYIAGMYEGDLVKITKSMILTEYEIKISKADFEKDFQKGSHYPTTKHDRMKSGECWSNYFYFVTPKGLIPIESIPEYAGLIEWDETTGKFVTIKVAKKLTKEKFYKGKEYKLLMTLTVRNNALLNKLIKSKTESK